MTDSSQPLPSSPPPPRPSVQQLLKDFRLLGGEDLLRAIPIPAPQLALDSIGDAIATLLDDALSSGRLPLTAAQTPRNHGNANRAYAQDGFARESLLMLHFAGEQLPTLERSILIQLATHQGTHDEPLSLDRPRFDQEELGKIPARLHAVDPFAEPEPEPEPATPGARPAEPPNAVPTRPGETADVALGSHRTSPSSSFVPTYGALDTTPLFLSALTKAVRRQPDLLNTSVLQHDGVIRTFGQVFLRCLDWIFAALERHPLGLLGTYAAENGSWQVWRDSPDAFHQTDGTLCTELVAPFSAQIHAYDALLDAAELVESLSVVSLAELLSFDSEHTGTDLDRPQPTNLGRPHTVRRLLTLRTFAENLRSATLQTMWVDRHGGYFAAGHQLSLPYTGPLTIRTADMGLALNSRFLEEDSLGHYRAALVEQLTDPSSPLVSPAGIRTLAKDEVRYRPGTTHNGAVWPWLNLWIAQGMRRHWFDHHAVELEAKTLRSIRLLQCYPEFVSGDDGSLNVGEIRVKSPNGNGSFFDHTVVRPAAPLFGPTLFGVWSHLSSTES